MARPRSQLHDILKNLDGVADAYFQAPTTGMQYPCIKYQRSRSLAFDADNLKYLLYKRYTVTVIDRDPDSLIPDQVEALPHSRFDRFYAVEGLNHFVFDLYF
jgi:hypothetical protein